MAAERSSGPRPRRLSTVVKRKLREPLAPEHVSERRGEDGEVVRYLEGWRAIQRANAIFGEDRWGAEVVGDVSYRPLPQTGRRNATPVLGIYTATVRVTVDGCQPHSDVGVASVSEQTPEEHATAAKTAVTDALKRALRHFGPAFANELYDSEPGDPVGVLQRRVLEIAERAGSDETRTRDWIAERYGCSLEELDGRRLRQAVERLSRGLDRRNGNHASAA